MNILFYPPIGDQATLSDLWHRACWYLPALPEARVTFLLEDADLRPGAAPACFGPTPPASFQGEFLAIGDAHEAAPRLKQADLVLVWREAMNRAQRYHLGNVERQILTVDRTSGFDSHEAYHWAIVRHELTPAAERAALLEDCKARLATVAESLRTKQAVVFGTGPSLERALDMDLPDGLRIVCNTAVCNRELMRRLKPRIVVAGDPALHYGVSAYAHGFRRHLLEYLRGAKALLFLPMGYAPLFLRHYPDLADQVFGVPVVPAKPENVSMDLLERYQTACYANVLPLFLLPVAATLAEEIGIVGCDGRAPANKEETGNPSPFWSHHRASEQEELYDTLKACHPSFFLRDYQDWYDDHCRSIDLVVRAVEARGRTVTSLTRSFIPALAARQTPDLRQSMLARFGSLSPEPPRHPDYVLRRDNRSRPAYKVSVIMSLYRADRFLAAALRNLFDQTLYAQDEVEILIVDSNSPGLERQTVAHAMETHKHIFFGRTRERETLYRAWNRALAEARGQYVMNLGCDDRLRLDALEMFADHLDGHPDVGLVYGNQYVTRFENGSFDDHVKFGYCRRPRFSPDMMLHKFYFGSELMWRRSLHDQVGYFDESFLVAGDYEMACRFATVTRFDHLDRYFGVYLKNLHGIEFSNMEACRKEDALIRERYKDAFPAPKDPPRVHVHFPTDPACPSDHLTIVIQTQAYDKPITPYVNKLFHCLEYPHVIYSVDQCSSQTTRSSIAHLLGEGLLCSGDTLLAHSRKLFTPPQAFQPRIGFYLLVFGEHFQIPFDFLNLKRPELTRRLRAFHAEVSARFKAPDGTYDLQAVQVFSQVHETKKPTLAPHRAVFGGLGSSRATAPLTVVIQHFAPERQTDIYREALRRCVDSVRAQDGGEEVRILVCDDGSHWSRGLCPDPGRPAILAFGREELAARPEFAGLDVDGYLYKARTGYFSKALLWNAALRLTGSERMIFLDDDHCFTGTEALNLYKKHLAGHELVIGNTRAYHRRDEDGATWTYALGFDSPVVQGSNFGIRRELLEAIGGFEENTFFWGTGDDPILFWKLFLALRPTPESPEFRACYVDDLVTDNPYSGRWQEHCRLDPELFVRQASAELQINPYVNPSRTRRLWVRRIPSARPAQTAEARAEACSADKPWLSVLLDGRGASREAVWWTLATALDQHCVAPYGVTVLLEPDRADGLAEGDLPQGVRALTLGDAPLGQALAALDTPGVCTVRAGFFFTPKTMRIAATALDAGAEAVYGGNALLTRAGHDAVLVPAAAAEPQGLLELCSRWTPGQPLFATTQALAAVLAEGDEQSFELRLLCRAILKGAARASRHAFSAAPETQAAVLDGRGRGKVLAALTGAELEAALVGAVNGLSPLRPTAGNAEPWEHLPYVHMVKRQTSRILDLHHRLRADGVTRAALYPAGLHTRRLLKIYWPKSVAVPCLLDDGPQAGEVGGVPVLRPGTDALPEFQAVVLSSKNLEETLEKRCRALGLAPVLAIYRRTAPEQA